MRARSWLVFIYSSPTTVRHFATGKQSVSHRGAKSPVLSGTFFSGNVFVSLLLSPYSCKWPCQTTHISLFFGRGGWESLLAGQRFPGSEELQNEALGSGSAVFLSGWQAE